MFFTKMHGLGNKYVFFNLLESSSCFDLCDLSELSRSVSDVNYGIGSDGMILICPSEQADFRMRIFNADGSEGKNCGNGLRCTAKYVFDHAYVQTRTFTIETLGGIVNVEVEPVLKRNRLSVQSIKLDMGEPGLFKATLPMKGDALSTTINEAFVIDGQTYHMTCVSMGNPHAILFVDHVNLYPLERYGPIIERAEIFPEKANVGIVHVLNDQELDYRVWERGSGLTMACGTGACAAVVAATLNNKLQRDRPVTVHLPGGDLTIRWDLNNHVWKSGPAEYICRGMLDVESYLNSEQSII